MEDKMSTITETQVQKPASPLTVRNFRLLWIGESISLLGDQFYMIALPWLVLQLTGNALALGTIMALVALLTVLVLTSAIQLWMLYIFALAFGLADAFFFPGQSAILPRILEED